MHMGLDVVHSRIWTADRRIAIASILLAAGVLHSGEAADREVSADTPPSVSNVSAIPQLEAEFLGWIGIGVQQARAVRLRDADWPGLARTLRLSEMQLQASLTQLPRLRADEAHAEVWWEGLRLEATQLDGDFESQRAELSERIRAHRGKVMDDVRTFFATIDEFMLADDQRAVADIVRRASERRIMLSTVFPAFPGLAVDPDWEFLVRRNDEGLIPIADAQIADLALREWRDEADTLVRRIVRLSDRLVAADLSPWRELTEGAAHLDDFLLEERLGRQLFVLQEDWLEHRSEFETHVAGLIDPGVLDAVLRHAGRGTCDHRDRLPRIDADEVTSDLADFRRNSESEDVREVLDAALSSIEDADAAGAERLDALCERWRAQLVGSYTHVPLLGSEAKKLDEAHRAAGDAWADGWRSHLTAIEDTGVRAHVRDVQVRRSIDRYVESIYEAIEMWERLRAIHFPS